MDPHDNSPATSAHPAAPSRDAVRSRAWRSRHGHYLESLLKAAGVASSNGSTRSYMAQLKKVFGAVWARALVEAPASMIRHDPNLSRAERRRISSVKNNRLCRHRHHVFLQGVERELQTRGMLPANIAELRGDAPAAAPHREAGHAAPLRAPPPGGHPQATARPGHAAPDAGHPAPSPAPRPSFGSRSDEA